MKFPNFSQTIKKFLLFSLANLVEIKKFLFINFARRCAVTALDLVGKNFEARHGVGFGIVTQEQIPVRLIGIGVLGIVFDLDQAGKNRPGLVEQCVFETECAFSVPRKMMLHCPLVEQLIFPAQGDRGVFKFRSIFRQSSFGFNPRLF